jgi:hypothetical protein
LKVWQQPLALSCSARTFSALNFFAQKAFSKNFRIVLQGWVKKFYKRSRSFKESKVAMENHTTQNHCSLILP